MLDRLYKVLLIVGIIIGVGVTLQRTTATASLAEVTAAKQAADEKVLVELVSQMAMASKVLERLDTDVRANDKVDAEVHAQVARNSAILDRLIGGSR